MTEPTTLISVVAPVYNDESGVGEFHRRVSAALARENYGRELELLQHASFPAYRGGAPGTEACPVGTADGVGL